MRSKIILLALVVLASGCIDNGQNDSAEPDTSEQASALADSAEDNTIYLTDSGFQPSELTIQQGETVTWINNASNSMWVATNAHPSHTNYAGSSIYQHCQMGDQTEPAFDQCHSEDEFSFTFEKTGEWSYHNHKRTGQRGTVIVQ